MYASYVEVEVQPGKAAEAIQRTKDLTADIGTIPNINRFMLIDKGNDKALFIAFYNTAEEQEGATPKAQELLGALADLMAAPPNRIQVEIAIDHTF